MPEHELMTCWATLYQGRGNRPIKLTILLFCLFRVVYHSWLRVSFLLHVKYTLSYRIVSYRMTSNRCCHVANDFTNFTVHAARCVCRAGESITYMQRRRHHRWLVAWYSGRTLVLVFDRRTFLVLCSTYS